MRDRDEDDGGMLAFCDKAGVRKVHIIDGRMSHSLLLEIFTDEGIGTQMIHEEDAGVQEPAK